MKGVSKRRCKAFVCGGEGIVFVVQYSYTSIFSFFLLAAAAPIFSVFFFFFLSFLLPISITRFGFICMHMA